eukprot:jgi/Pico_ML_1/53479/g4016.t1
MAPYPQDNSSREDRVAEEEMRILDAVKENREKLQRLTGEQESATNALAEIQKLV